MQGTIVAFLRTMLFTSAYCLATIFYGVLSILLWLLPAKVRQKIILTWTRFIVFWLRLTCGVRHRVEGAENMQNLSQPVVVLAKHQSTWETIFLQNLFSPASTILKRELLSIPFFGWGLRALSPIAIDRSNPREALRSVKSEGIQRLEQGFNLILFPEGTRMKPGEKGKYARSGADIALSAGADIVPVAVNAGKCWPPGRYVKLPGQITVSVGAPISVQGKQSKQIMQEVEDWIENKMASFD